MNYDFEERAAIKEFDGGMDRETAEDQAFEEAIERDDGGDPECLRDFVGWESGGIPALTGVSILIRFAVTNRPQPKPVCQR